MFSFTGGKASFKGDMNFYGKSGLDFYTKTKTVTSAFGNQQEKMQSTVTMPVHS